jgi:hypothetical protein
MITRHVPPREQDMVALSNNSRSAWSYRLGSCDNVCDRAIGTPGVYPDFHRFARNFGCLKETEHLVVARIIGLEVLRRSWEYRSIGPHFHIEQLLTTWIVTWWSLRFSRRSYHK